MNLAPVEPSLSEKPRVKEMARELGLTEGAGCARSVARYALRRVRSLAEETSVSTTGALLRLCAEQLDVEIELVASGKEARDVAERYGQHNPLIALQIEEELESEAEGWLARNPLHGRQEGERRFMIVVDARGKGRSRAYFTIWHELAHLLTKPPGETGHATQHRSPTKRQKQADPEERLVDHIASHLAFYQPFFQPALRSAMLARGDVLSLAAIEEATEETFAEETKASLWAAARASLQIVRRPACLVEATPMLKKSRKRRKQKASGDLFGHEPEKELRLRQCLRNEAARRNSKLEIQQHNARARKITALAGAS